MAKHDIDSRATKNKKILKWLFFYPIVAGIVILLVGSVINVLTEDDRMAEQAEAMRLRDSLEKAELMQLERHDSLMRTNKAYADSVRTQRRNDSLAALEQDRKDNPSNHLELDLDWEKGGFGSVALAVVKFNNKSLKTCVNPVVRVTFYSDNGTSISSKKESVYVTIPPGKRTSSAELNLGFVNRQVSRAGVELVEASWE